MGKPAARLGDQHQCPAYSGDTPHQGGPILMGASTVLIAGKPAARVGDQAKCNGPISSIVKGSETVKIEGKPAARMGDQTAHGGQIMLGDMKVLIG